MSKALHQGCHHREILPGTGGSGLTSQAGVTCRHLGRCRGGGTALGGGTWEQASPAPQGCHLHMLSIITP